MVRVGSGRMIFGSGRVRSGDFWFGSGRGRKIWVDSVRTGSSANTTYYVSMMYFFVTIHTGHLTGIVHINSIIRDHMVTNQARPDLFNVWNVFLSIIKKFE